MPALHHGGEQQMKLATDIGGTFTDLVYVDERKGELGLATEATDFSLTTKTCGNMLP